MSISRDPSPQPGKNDLMKQLNQLHSMLEDRGFELDKNIQIYSLLSIILKDNDCDVVQSAKKVSKGNLEQQKKY